MDIFHVGLLVSFLVTLGLTIKAHQGTESRTPSSVDFKRFQRSFLVVYYISMTADWLQGPYVYALYSSYGFSKHDIAVLFIGGFGASMLFGTFAGVLSDKLGRKRSCIACAPAMGRVAKQPAPSAPVTLVGGRWRWARWPARAVGRHGELCDPLAARRAPTPRSRASLPPP